MTISHITYNSKSRRQIDHKSRHLGSVCLLKPDEPGPRVGDEVSDSRRATGKSVVLAAFRHDETNVEAYNWHREPILSCGAKACCEEPVYHARVLFRRIPRHGKSNAHRTRKSSNDGGTTQLAPGFDSRSGDHQVTRSRVAGNTLTHILFPTSGTSMFAGTTHSFARRT